jgi:hypothetical protein
MKITSLVVLLPLLCAAQVQAASSLFSLNFMAQLTSPQQTCSQLAADLGQRLATDQGVAIFNANASSYSAPNDSLCAVGIQYAAPGPLLTTSVTLTQLTNCSTTLNQLSLGEHSQAGLKMFAGACYQDQTHAGALTTQTLTYLAIGYSRNQLIVTDLGYSLSAQDQTALTTLIQESGGNDVFFNDHQLFYFSPSALAVVYWQVGNFISKGSTLYFRSTGDCEAQMSDMTQFLEQAGLNSVVGLCYQTTPGASVQPDFFHSAQAMPSYAKFIYQDVPTSYPDFATCMADKSRVVTFYKTNLSFNASFAFCAQSESDPYTHLRLIGPQ